MEGYKLVLQKVKPKRVLSDEQKALAKAKRDAKLKSDKPKVVREKVDKSDILAKVQDILGVSLDEANEKLLADI